LLFSEWQHLRAGLAVQDFEGFPPSAEGKERARGKRSKEGIKSEETRSSSNLI